MLVVVDDERKIVNLDASTDNKGQFTLQAPFQKLARFTLQLLPDDPARKFEPLKIALPELLKDETDLGNLRMKERPLLIAGHIVDDDGQPVPGVLVRGEGINGDHSKAGLVVISAGGQVTQLIGKALGDLSDSQGRFTNYSRTSASEVRMFCDSNGGNSELICKPGATELFLEFAKQATLRGQITINGESTADALQIELHSPGEKEDIQHLRLTPNLSYGGKTA
ncbi:MAG: hypothetical protein ACI97A_003204 [Planctomycetota bacterium]